MKKKRALITGITGQDGSYLSEFLINKGYQVHGIRKRESSGDNLNKLKHLNLIFHEKKKRYNFTLRRYHQASSSLNQILQKTKPHEIYNLAEQSPIILLF